MYECYCYLIACGQTVNMIYIVKTIVLVKMIKFLLLVFHSVKLENYRNIKK